MRTVGIFFCMPSYINFLLFYSQRVCSLMCVIVIIKVYRCDCKNKPHMTLTLQLSLKMKVERAEANVRWTLQVLTPCHTLAYIKHSRLGYIWQTLGLSLPTWCIVNLFIAFHTNSAPCPTIKLGDLTSTSWIFFKFPHAPQLLIQWHLYMLKTYVFKEYCHFVSS